MSLNDKEKFWDEDEEGGGESGKGGQTGEVHFRYHDVMSTEPRDDALPANQIKHLEKVHQSVHKALVDKQKDTIKSRLAAKEGKLLNNTSQYRLGQGGGGGGSNQFKQHWINAMAQFSGMNDKEINQSPTLNEADTNDKLKDELQHRLNLNYRPGQKFNPKPQMR